jgi:hypothetical protein
MSLGGGYMQWIAYGSQDVYVYEYPNYRYPYPWWSKDAIAIMRGDQSSKCRRAQHKRLKHFTRKTANMHRLGKIRSVIRIIGRTQLFKRELFCAIYS